VIDTLMKCPHRLRSSRRSAQNIDLIDKSATRDDDAQIKLPSLLCSQPVIIIIKTKLASVSICCKKSHRFEIANFNIVSANSTHRS